MIKADSVHSTPRTDSSRLSSEREVTQNELSWQAGYAAGYTAKMAGMPTPRAPHGVDGLSYASGAVEGAAASERELDPRDVIADVLEELLIEDPRAVARTIIERLRDAGFEIKPAKSANSFSQLADAEAFLKAQGFWLVADSCDWTNVAGDDAGCYAIDGRYGTVKVWRVEINRRSGGQS